MVGQTRKLKWSLDDLDLNRPIEPLSRLVDEPEKLIDEVFKIAAQYLPKDIVPSSLKDIPTVELKKLCLEQLKKVERKTLLNILTDGSNEPDVDADQSKITPTETKDADKLVASGSGISKIIIEDDIQVVFSSLEKVHSEGVDKSDHCPKKLKRSKQVVPTSSAEITEEKKTEKLTNEDSIDDSNLDNILDKAASEIRELELRAQAIRELLKKHEDADNANQVTEEISKDSRKRQRTASDGEGNANVQKDSIVSDGDDDNKMPIKRQVIEQRAKDVVMKTPPKPVSRLTRNPVSMIEEDEIDEKPSSSTDSILKPDGRRKSRRKRHADETSSNMMIDLDNDSDDSIDRELKGE